MKSPKFMAVAMAAIMLVSCGNYAKNGALIGTGGGAALGALVGNLIGKNTKSTLIGSAIGTAVGATAGTLIGKHMDKVKAAAEAVKNAQVSTVTDPNGLEAIKVVFDNGILFNVGKADLQAAAKSSLSQFATNVLNAYPTLDVTVNGFASSDGSDATNLTLSQNRANAVTNYLTGTCGVNASQIKITKGWGETPEYLVLNADGTENQAASRRVEIYLSASEALIEAANAGTLN